MTENTQTLTRREFLRIGAELAVLGVTVGCSTPRVEPRITVSRPIINGFNFSSFIHGEYSTSASDLSMKNLAKSGANSLALVTTGFQQDIDSTIIFQDQQRTASDEDLTHTVSTAHDLGLTVMLKPHLNLITEDDTHWRGTIGTNFADSSWDAWFHSYQDLIIHYAKFAQDKNIEKLCIGTELVNTTLQDSRWRQLIVAIRQNYQGSLTYAANFYQEYTQVNFWDQLDLIGVNAYFPLTDKNDPDIKELISAWQNKGYTNSLETLSGKFKKDILFTEVGYRSIKGSNSKPWEWRNPAPFDDHEQANCYRAVQEVFSPKDWFAGMYWWAWEVNPDIGGSMDTGYTPFKKEAEKLIKIQ